MLNVDVANRALLLIGSPKVISSMTQDSLEAQTANQVLTQLRDELNRMAPWDCVTKWAPLTYISTIPGNPENPNQGPSNWQIGLPPPPWSYEYQYPVDCLRARKIIPQYTTQAGGVPIFPPGTVTGAAQTGWTGPALKFKVATDTFFSVSAAIVNAAGTGYAVGDIITLQQPTFNFTQNSAPIGQPPALSSFSIIAGAPAQLVVNGVGGGGAITSIGVVNQVSGETTPVAGSYFAPGGVTQPQATTTGGGVGATFNLTWTAISSPQRVILCNITQAILCYNAQIFDPNVMDPLFQDAWIHVLAARLAYQLSGDRGLANDLITKTNAMIMEARKVDGNEGITVNDVTPDFLRVRGGYGAGPNWEYSPNMDFDWGSFYSPY